MRLNLSHIFMIALVCFFALTSLGHAQTLFMTDIPGETESENGGGGITLEIIRAMFERADLPLEEKFYPWPRAVKHAAKNGFIAPFSRNEERENRFTWIEPIVSLTFVFVSLDQPISSMSAAKKLDKIGVWRGTSMEKELIASGFTNLLPVDNGSTLKNALLRGRIDAWYGSIAEARAILSDLAQESRQRVRFSEVIKTQPVWLASGKSVPASTIQKLQQAFQSLSDEGAINRIVRSRDHLFEQ